MQDQKKVLQLENVYWNSMEELVGICHPRWKNLSDVDKARYFRFQFDQMAQKPFYSKGIKTLPKLLNKQQESLWMTSLIHEDVA